MLGYFFIERIEYVSKHKHCSTQDSQPKENCPGSRIHLGTCLNQSHDLAK